MKDKESAALRAKVISIGKETLKNSYSPYSNFKVSAVVVSESATIYQGCNIENASYSLTVCAEVAAISRMVTSGEQSISQIYVFSSTDQFIIPCGGCRQSIREFSKQDIPIYLVNSSGAIRQHTLKEVLPHAFSFEHAD